MTRLFRLTADRSRTDGCWALDGFHDLRDLTLADAVLVWLTLRWTGVPFRITPQTTVAAPAVTPPAAATVPTRSAS